MVQSHYELNYKNLQRNKRIIFQMLKEYSAPGVKISYEDYFYLLK